MMTIKSTHKERDSDAPIIVPDPDPLAITEIDDVLASTFENAVVGVIKGEITNLDDVGLLDLNEVPVRHILPLYRDVKTPIPFILHELLSLHYTEIGTASYADAARHLMDMLEAKSSE